MQDRIKNISIANQIAVVVILLMAIGSVFVFSASANILQDLDLQKFYSYSSLRQLIFFPLACMVMLIISCIDYRKLSLANGFLKSPSVYILAISTILLIVVLIPGIGIEKNYARRWLLIPAGPIQISFQPSELAKWAVIIFLAAVCDKYNDRLRVFFKGFLPICTVIGFVAALIIIEDFGTAAYIMLLSFLILLIAGAKLRYLLAPFPFAVAGFFYVIIHSPERVERIKAFLEPEKWADSAAYQATQSLIALGSGGFWGKGLGRGTCKYGHLPEDTTDFIFAIIGEELGFFGTTAVIILFIAFVWLGMQVVAKCRNRFGQFLAGGIVLAISIQAAFNIGVVTVVLPTKGIPLPFVSAGGTSLLLSAAAIGILLNIAKQSSEPALGDFEK
jgi:cell division protein FtsW